MLLAGAAALLGLHAQAEVKARGQALPAVALNVEWRWVDAPQPPAVAGTIADGGRVSSTAGSFDTRPGLTLRSAPADEAPIRRLRVMNGEQATLRLAAPGTPAQQVVLWRGRKGDHGAVNLVDAVRVQSFSVRPRWPGGRAQVSLEIEAESGDAAAPSRWATTLAVPLGLWAAVATVGAATPGTPEPGTVSTRDAAPVRTRELQVRVTR